MLLCVGRKTRTINQFSRGRWSTYFPTWYLLKIWYLLSVNTSTHSEGVARYSFRQVWNFVDKKGVGGKSYTEFNILFQSIIQEINCVIFSRIELNRIVGLLDRLSRIYKWTGCVYSWCSLVKILKRPGENLTRFEYFNYMFFRKWNKDTWLKTTL